MTFKVAVKISLHFPPVFWKTSFFLFLPFLYFLPALSFNLIFINFLTLYNHCLCEISISNNNDVNDMIETGVIYLVVFNLHG